MASPFEIEALFCLSAHDLRERLARGDDYSILKAAAIVRQLFIDEHPLFDAANKRFGLSCIFAVPDTAYDRLIDNAKPVFSMRGNFLDSTLPPGLQPVIGNRQAFLGATVLHLDFLPITVKVLVKHAANVLGGVHRGVSITPEEIALSNATSLFEAPQQCVAPAQLRPVCKAVLLAIEPLEGVIRSALNGHGVVLPWSVRPKLFAKTGCVTFRWRTPAEPMGEVLLAEVVGGKLTNRLGVIQCDDGKIALRVIGSSGRKTHVTSKRSVSAEELFCIAVTWADQTVHLHVDGILEAEAAVPEFPDRLGAIFVGIDIDGLVGADALVQGFKVDGIAGLSVRKNGRGEGSRLSDFALFERPLGEDILKQHAKASADELAEFKAKRD